MKTMKASKALTLAVLLMLSTGVQAAITESMLKQFKVDIRRVVTDFYMYVLTSGNSDYLDMMKESIEQGRKMLQTMSDAAESDAARDLVSDLRESWSSFTELVLKNQIVERGYPSRYTLRDLVSARAGMMKRMNKANFVENGSFVDVATLSAKIQNIAAEYVRYAAAPAGGTGTAFASGERLVFDKAVADVSAKLKKLIDKYADNRALSRTLEQVRLRWRFIRESLINFSEDTVAYVVHRYSRHMTDELQLAIDLASSTGVQKPMKALGKPMPGPDAGLEGGQ